jgi:transcriptional/translational regulatory protein YebC/TACO1
LPFGSCKVAHALEKAGIKADSAEIAYIPTTTVPVTDTHLAQSIVKLHNALDELDDVQNVFSNEEMDEATSAAAHG